MKSKKRKKRVTKWSSSTLARLNDIDFINVFATAISDRSILKTGPLKFENKIKKGAPGHSIKLLLKEAERRKIPLSTIAEKFVEDAFTGKSFVSDLCAPSSWKRYEIHSAGALLTLMKEENVIIDSYEFDARIIGKITKRERQIDLLLKRYKPEHIVACEFRNYQESTITIEAVEAFSTKLKDIDVNKGVMFTPLGYQSGAIVTAKHYGISLFKFREVGSEELKDLYPEKAPLISAENKYWILERDDNTSWIFSGNLTKAP